MRQPPSLRPRSRHHSRIYGQKLDPTKPKPIYRTRVEPCPRNMPVRHFFRPRSHRKATFDGLVENRLPTSEGINVAATSTPSTKLIKWRFIKPSSIQAEKTITPVNS